ncbi:hypothetical protein VTJ83DRAFT_6230 [Remersonia thermophila]|uniref:Clr5 domain-containing protein n=1 Tax=Remersonia thermophila TaxID=72144 RepID=A0ABR4D485_9PEZI
MSTLETHRSTADPIPAAAIRTMASTDVIVDRQSRTIQGPTAREWETHRETIIRLYRQYPLKKVSEIMRTQHGFLASKRMYDKRFREWNVFKNSNGDERIRAARRARMSPASLPSRSSGGPDGSGQDGLRKPAQVARVSQQDLQHTSPMSQLPTSSAAQGVPSPPVSEPSRHMRRSISISDLIKHEDATQNTTSAPRWAQLLSPPQEPFSLVDTPCMTPESSPQPSEEEEQRGSSAAALPAPQSPNMIAYQSQLQHLFQTPQGSLCLDPQTRTMSIISRKLDEYYDWQLSHIPEGAVPDDYLGHRSPQESTRYWSTIKNAIYLVKISINSKEDDDLRPDRRAWSTFAEAGQLAAAAMTSQPFDFLRNLFATLSPVNTRARPELRNILLRFLTSEAQRALSPNHPITQICQELQKDEGNQEISRRSLQCMLDIFNRRLQRSRAITFKLLDSLATLLRRSGEYRAGLEIATELLHASRPVFGAESDQVRSVENELAHFYMLTGDADMALGHCMSVVTRPPRRPGEAPSFYQDGIAAHAMEDLAEIHQRRGDLEQCISWLERAASIALVVWGPKDIATSHLVDKMTSLQRQLGRDLLESAALWEATIVSEDGDQLEKDATTARCNGDDFVPRDPNGQRSEQA